MNNKSSKINSIIKKMSSILVAGLLAISSIGAAKAPVGSSPKTSNLSTSGPTYVSLLETPLTFTANEANSTVALSKQGSPNWSGQYKITLTSGSTCPSGHEAACSTWQTYTPGATENITLKTVGDTVSFKGNISDNFSSTEYLNFVMTGNISASGNINSIYDSDDYSNLTTLTYEFCYTNLFQTNNENNQKALTDVSDLLLPATTLSRWCYANMFNKCIELKAPPALPATELANYCYQYMFAYCSELEAVPALPATSLKEGCYNSMFLECSKLKVYSSEQTNEKVKWKIPTYDDVTSLDTSATTNMFKGTIGDYSTEGSTPITAVGQSVVLYTTNTPKIDLISVPLTFTAKGAVSTVELKPMDQPQWEGKYQICKTGEQCGEWVQANFASPLIITLENVGDTVSFKGKISEDFDSSRFLQFVMSGDISASGNINSMYVSDGFSTLTELGYKYCYYKLFYDCSALKDISNLLLPATTLANYCYNSMFYGCTNLTTIPVDLLPATTLEDHCYESMFNGCTSLTTAPALPATTLVLSCYATMFQGCTNLTTAPELPATTLANYCYDSMFSGCTNLRIAPALPATALANFCYNSMFYGCTSLTTAPELPATTLMPACYYSMFSGCTNLTTAPALPATTLANNCYQNMFKDCANLKIYKSGSGDSISIPSTGSVTSIGTNSVDGMFKGTTGDFETVGTPEIAEGSQLVLYLQPELPPVIGGGIIIELPTTLDPNYDPTIKPEEPVVIKIKLLLTSNNLIYDESNHTLYVGDLPDDVTYTITGELYYTDPGDYFIKADFIYDEDKYAPIESISKTFTIA